jgi:membrane-associated phospholipid phosphatase
MTLISTLVALSRVFLFKHLLSQVVIGAAIGIILGVVFYKLLKRIKWINN